jgi:hypothetical protein
VEFGDEIWDLNRPLFAAVPSWCRTNFYDDMPYLVMTTNSIGFEQKRRTCAFMAIPMRRGR